MAPSDDHDPVLEYCERMLTEAKERATVELHLAIEQLQAAEDRARDILAVVEEMRA